VGDIVQELISVIVPVYNAEKYLVDCLESLLKQSYKNLEIILINDGSKDSSGMICDDYAKKDNRIKVIHQENSGVSNARNNGLSIMKGKYFSFVDSDDVVDFRYFEILYNNIKKSDFDICIAKTHSFKDNEMIKSTNNGILKIFSFNEEREEKITQIINKYFGSGAATKLYKNNKSNLKFEKIKIGEDLLFNIDYLLSSKNAVILDYDGYYYRKNQESLTNSIKKDLFESLDKIIVKRKFDLPIYKVYCFRIYNEQLYNIYKNDKSKVCFYLKQLNEFKNLKNIITKKENVKEIIKLVKSKKIYIKIITFLIRNNCYKIASLVEKCKYLVKEIRCK